ncbi:MAG: hypothetical protein AAF968_18970 [Pseudomonadota bacterium]
MTTIKTPIMPAHASGERTAPFTAIERRRRMPAEDERVKALHRQAQIAPTGQMSAYLRLDRGERL